MSSAFSALRLAVGPSLIPQPHGGAPLRGGLVEHRGSTTRLHLSGGEERGLADGPHRCFTGAWRAPTGWVSGNRSSLWSIAVSGGTPKLRVRFDLSSGLCGRSEFSTDGDTPVPGGRKSHGAPAWIGTQLDLPRRGCQLPADELDSSTANHPCQRVSITRNQSNPLGSRFVK